MGKPLVIQFQEEIVAGRRSIQDLIRMAQLIPGKLGLNDLQRWIEYELDGYPDDESIPDYREITTGTLQYLNPYRGWCTAIGQRTFRLPVTQAVTELEAFAKKKLCRVHQQKQGSFRVAFWCW